ncbi:hypothetical protein DH2020_007127 [Rehmannia glutinosa]|uniref:Uncharacterized protein n=1 Tax=Rehmannia glutinosa TaxID=99300 RepID=A0ABR0TX40_REHGL
MATEEASVENGFKDTKKKKRRYRRGKQNHSLSASCSVNEMCMDESRPSSDHVVSSGHNQQQKECNMGFSSIPAMHLNKQIADGNPNSDQSITHEISGVVFSEIQADVAAHCNEKKLASRRVKDATDKLYMWALLKKNKQILYSEARVLGLGPKFMSIYIAKLAIERRIYYDEVEGLTVEWLDATSTLLLSLSMHKRPNRKSGLGKFRPLKEIALIVSPIDLNLETSLLSGEGESGESLGYGGTSDVINLEPSVFPLTLRILSTIPVALHATGGDDGPLDIMARLYISSYFQCVSRLIIVGACVLRLRTLDFSVGIAGNPIIFFVIGCPELLSGVEYDVLHVQIRKWLASIVCVVEILMERYLVEVEIFCATWV